MNEELKLNNLSSPWRRRELTAYLDEIIDKDAQKVEWGDPNKSSTDDIDAVFHFFFDDTDFGVDAGREIGISLVSVEEAAAISNLTSALDDIFRKVGNAGSQTYIRDPGWNFVIEKAKFARDLMASSSIE